MPDSSPAKFATQPLVSVVISVKNRPQELGDCLRGLAAQELPRDQFEVVVIDNCSSENLTPVLEHARTVLGLDLHTQRTKVDGGPAPARNLGVTMARAPIIAFTDSDCRPSPQWLARGIAPFSDPALGLSCGPTIAKPEQSAGWRAKAYFHTAEHPSYPTSNLFVRRAQFLQLNGFDTSLSFRDPFDRAVECADTDLAWRIIESGAGKVFVPEAVMHHELVDLSTWHWMIESTRLICLPELIRRHPQLRGKLLTFGLFFHLHSWFNVAFFVIVGLASLHWPMVLVLALVVALARSALRHRSLNPGVILRHTALMPLHALRSLLLIATLVLSSLRFRCLVL